MSETHSFISDTQSFVSETQSFVSPGNLSDRSQALAVPLLQVPRHTPAVGELHIAEFTTKLFSIF